ncbi:MAG: C1 family peptidase [Rikenellaceae bacterium]
MKKLILSVALLSSVATLSFAQKKKAATEEKPAVYQFTDTKVNPVTSVKNQGSSGTCWCYSSLAMVEADILKDKGVDVDLAEMWVVRHAYFEKVVKYIRMHGKTNLGPGGNAHDVPNMIAKYGIVPQDVYEGLEYGTDINKHGEINNLLESFANTIIRNPNKQLSTGWIKALNGILDAYFGELVTEFTVDGKKYTPQSYADALGINPDDYVSYTSYTHHPFGTSFAVEIPDNWMWGESVNVCLDEFMKISEQVIENGYSICWGSDVSDKGFKYADTFAVLPETQIENLKGSDQEKWTGKEAAKFYEFTEIVPEIDVTQEYRQECFDNYVSTDDHGMLIYGLATDQEGNKYFKVKNSWGEKGNALKGHFYTSYPFYAGRTISIMFNKKALK